MSTLQKSPVRKGDELELTVTSLAYGGRGVARAGELVVFVDGAIPGQTVTARVYRKKSAYAEARALEIRTESPQAVAPPCRHFPHCGGCKLQQLSYDEQMEQKRQQLTEIFRRQAGLPDFTVDEVIPAVQIYNYRNKMEFTASGRPWLVMGAPEPENQDFALGLHIPGRFDKILDIEACQLQPPVGNEILALVRAAAIEQGLKPYDPKTHNGFLRHLALRFTGAAERVLVNLVTAWENPVALQPLVAALTARFPQIVGIVNNVNTRRGDMAVGEKEILLHGAPVIEERLGGLTFEVSANSFFQTNTVQAEKLYQAVLAGADLTGGEVLYDLFCGTGAIALFLARQAREVYGFELVPSAVEDATRNALNNGIVNARFHVANLDFFLQKSPLAHSLPPPDVLVLDPPRGGIHERLARHLPRFGARRIIYVSCNPTTQARDIRWLLDGGYRLQKTTLVDMFPHTPHIETVAVFDA